MNENLEACESSDLPSSSIEEETKEHVVVKIVDFKKL
jgi:hypothetical protein